MLTDPKLRSQVDRLWDKLWSGGLTNPLDAIEQLSFLIFLKRLDDEENQRERMARMRGESYEPQLAEELRWNNWSRKPAAEALKHVREIVFPALREMGVTGSSFERYMENAEFKISKASLLIEACRAIDEMEISQQQQDVQGDLYEYLLSKLNTAGRNGQFRTPRHIIRMMVQMIAPQPGERVGDLAAGTCGFLVNAYQYILEQHTSEDILEYDEQGWPHKLTGDQLTPEQWDFLQGPRAFRGYDNDSGLTMHRIGSMNLMLHGLENPQYFYADTLSKEYDEPADYDVILMNPPFKGRIDKSDIHDELPANTVRSEIIFVHRILRALDMGGRCAVIVPDGVLFGSTRAHRTARKKIIESNRLMGLVSMPSGVFKPYAGVSTAILIFSKGGETADEIWFYDMAADGFSLDDKRQPVSENDIPDILDCWKNRDNAEFYAQREARRAELVAQLEPLQQERLHLEGELNRLEFEQVLANGDDGAAQDALEAVEEQMETLRRQMRPIKAAIDQLDRHFYVNRKDIKANKYDLSASRYREAEQDPVFYEQPETTIRRLLKLEQTMRAELSDLQVLLQS